MSYEDLEDLLPEEYDPKNKYADWDAHALDQELANITAKINQCLEEQSDLEERVNLFIEDEISKLQEEYKSRIKGVTDSSEIIRHMKDLVDKKEEVKNKYKENPYLRDFFKKIDVLEDQEDALTHQLLAVKAVIRYKSQQQ